jgi:hypothetical protein
VLDYLYQDITLQVLDYWYRDITLQVIYWYQGVITEHPYFQKQAKKICKTDDLAGERVIVTSTYLP